MALPPIGLRHRESVTVDASLTVPKVSPAFPHFHDMPPVFATAFMVGFVEETCVAALEPHLEPGQRTVGTRVDLSHEAATPIGMTVTVDIELVEVDGKRLRFKVEARDDKDVIGRGHHERFIIDEAKFMARLETKTRS
ncbi:thioesterase family protein [Hypericibacter sp.]|uniref:thioesterase family protein n=1 Tax=Hypericibacter sp. TaxID=2705401 RepID=UPI003D6CE2F4